MDLPGDPHLLNNLRTALGILYSLPQPVSANGQPMGPLPSSREAHQFLMQYQSRNVRRKLHSLAKSQKQKQREGSLTPFQSQTPSLEPEDYGSTWLSSLALLVNLANTDSSRLPVHYTEALFAAQTLVHRLRRVKTSEAIDIEFEPPVHGIPSHPHQLCETYLFWMEKFDPTIRVLFQQFSPKSMVEASGGGVIDEDCLKGEFTLMTLMAIMYRVTLVSIMDLGRIRPLLVTLASAISATAARLRYTSASIPSPSPNTQPIVTMILQTLNMVRQVFSTSLTASGQLYSAEHHLGTYIYLFYTCMAVVPDAILAGSGSGGGAHGRMSMDPRCYTAITTEVRTQGISQVWEAFIGLPNPEGEQLVLFLHMCEEWAKYAPLPMEFVQRSIPLLESAFAAAAAEHTGSEQQHFQISATARAAMCYWTAIMEGGSWTVDQVLSASLIQKNENSQQPNKKKQSSKSKKRQKEVLEERTTMNQLVLAQNEVHHRGEVALQTAQKTWSTFQTLLAKELAAVTDTDDDVPGDGPVGAITACANACLPYLIREPSQTEESVDLFVSIARGIQEVCSSPSRLVRNFAAETLYILHEAVLHILHSEKQPVESRLEKEIIEHFFQCATKLALRCGYPLNYFQDLGENNDEDLESERNDVRDVLRTLSSTVSSEGFSTKSISAQNLSTAILVRLLHACAEPILSQPVASGQLYPETAMHAFSALARPLISIASSYSLTPDSIQGEVLKLSLNVISMAGQRLTQALPSSQLSDSLPLARLYNLAVASLSPMLSILARMVEFEGAVTNVIDVGIQAAKTSLMYVPELAAPSTLRSTRYDIRGAMRTPGGEDHAAVLALMRLSTESEWMSYIFIRSREMVVVDLCELYRQLKNLEIERGRFVLHGKGLLPKSRRILLGVVCHLETTTCGAAGVSDTLKNMFETSVSSIARMSRSDCLSADVLFQITEDVFDVAAYSPHMVHSLFQFSEEDSTATQALCLHVLLEAGNFGYQVMSDPSLSDDALAQWNRLRAALFCLFRVCGKPDLPDQAINMMKSWIQTECNASITQCNLGASSKSHLFSDDLISEENVPAGVFIQILGDILDSASNKGIPLTIMSNCVRVLFDCRVDILQSIASPCPSPVEKGSFCDPRPTLAEAWLLVVIKLMKGVLGQGGMVAIAQHSHDLAKALDMIIVETCVSSVALLLYPSLGKTQNDRLDDPGLSTDGPHMLVMMEFFQIFFGLGPLMLQAVARELLGKIPIDIESIRPYSIEPDAAGIAIIGAAIFRAVQGGLPPWAVECMPAIYSSLYTALEQNPEHFAVVIQTSMHVRLASSHDFGGVKAGMLLSGKYFDSMGNKAKSTFVAQAVQIARTNTPSSWKRLKALIKQACGGKKKDTDFKQRPALTRWDAMDRI